LYFAVRSERASDPVVAYDAGGRRTLKLLANGTRASHTYDAADQLAQLANLKSDGSVISSFAYQYSACGNRTSVLEADGARVTWTYDPTSQLTGEHRSGAHAFHDQFVYDPVGNRLLKDHDGALTTYTYDAANQLVTSQDAGGTTGYTFDANGNQQVTAHPDGTRTTYAWDYENQMSLALLPAGERVTMAYNADKRRVRKEE
jgi:YD repeat-containing protein